MVRPVLDIKTVEQGDLEIAACTIMEHNDPPSLLVMVTDFPTSNMFSGVCLNTGVYTENDWYLDEFHIFKGEVTLRQGI